MSDQGSDQRVVTKAVPLYAIELDEHEGIVKGFPAVLGNWDLDREMVPPGAFAATIAGAGKRAPMGRDHKHPLGVTTLLQEVSRGDLPARMKAEYPDAAGALYAEGVVSMFPDNLEWLQEEKRRIARGTPSGMSFVGRPDILIGDGECSRQHSGPRSVADAARHLDEWERER